DDRGNAQLARNDGRMAGAPAAVGDDRGGTFHDGLPVRVGHVGHQHVAALHTCHFLDAADDARRAAADALADGAAAGEHLGLALVRVALHGAPAAALLGLRAGLQDVGLAGLAVLAPLDVHGTAVVFL